MKKFKIFTFFILFLCFFIGFSFSFWLENAKIFLDFSGNHSYLKYNSSLAYAKNWDYENALKNLPKDLQNYDDRLFELRGDILYRQNAEKSEVIEAYRKSLEYAQNPRVQAKIDFLENKKSENSETKNDENNSPKHSSEILQKEQQLLDEQQNRQKFLNPYRNHSDDLETFKTIFSSENFSEKKDW